MRGTTWSTTKDRVFQYHRKTKQLSVLDMNLEPSHHPLEDAVKQYKDLLEFSLLNVHPNLPFVILSGGKIGSTFISWSKDKINSPHLLIADATDFIISPDGKWVVFKHYFDSNTNQTYIMPVSEKYPHYLGSPILLSNDSVEVGHGAWKTRIIQIRTRCPSMITLCRKI
jgi:hypothetical protein